MASEDDSIRPEASTVHRSPDAAGLGSDDETARRESTPASSEATPGSASGTPGSASGASGESDSQRSGGSAIKDQLEDQQLEQAKTVIRGSSRAIKRAGDHVERSPATVAKVLLGQRLNHFYLEELIGGGGMGAVFRARDEQLDRVVAIKVIPFVGDDPDLQRRFRNEAQSAAKLDHPRIARVFDVGNDGEWHYIVFEYIRGTNIRDMVINGGVLPIDDAVFYTCQLAAALQHASDRGIVHRDIKPSNVLIGDEDKIKLVDMGLARSENFEISEDMTASGVTLGTFDYISPEQARDPRDADLRSDIYSLGCTLYFMLTGRPPYPGGTMLQKLLSHGNAPPPDARELRGEVSDELMAVIQKMLAKNPADRYQTADDLIADLREVAFLDGLTRSQAIGPVAIRQPNPIVEWLETHAPWVVALTLLLATVGWLHLDSLASQQELTVPDTAVKLEKSTKTVPPPPPIPASSSEGDQPSAQGTDEVTNTGRPANGAADRNEEGNESSPNGVQEPPAAPEVREETNGGATGDQETVEQGPAFAQDEASDNDGSVMLDPFETVRPPAIRVVASEVTFGGGRDSDGAVLATKLADAFELADQYGVDHIEIAVPVLYCEASTVFRENHRVTSSVAGGSVIVFQPEESIDGDRLSMLNLGDHRIELEDLHFVWRVPSGQSTGGTLFEVGYSPSVRMTDCSVTIDNPAQREQVYAFEILGSEDADESEDRGLPLVGIELNNVIIRGQAGMIRMEPAVALQVSWDNGLLAISDLMIDTTGANVELSPTSPPIQLQFTRLTSHTGKGILRMWLRANGAFPVAVDRFAQDCVFVVERDEPHFEFVAPDLFALDSSLLQLRGSSNSYDTDATLAAPLMVIRDTQGEELARFNDLSQRWPDEVSPRWKVYWLSRRLSDASPNQLAPSDYRLDGAVRGGFSEALLPILPNMEAIGLGSGANATVSDGSVLPREL